MSGLRDDRGLFVGGQRLRRGFGRIAAGHKGCLGAAEPGAAARALAGIVGVRFPAPGTVQGETPLGRAVAPPPAAAFARMSGLDHRNRLNAPQGRTSSSGVTDSRPRAAARPRSWPSRRCRYRRGSGNAPDSSTRRRRQAPAAYRIPGIGQARSLARHALRSPRRRTERRTESIVTGNVVDQPRSRDRARSAGSHRCEPRTRLPTSGRNAGDQPNGDAGSHISQLSAGFGSAVDVTHLSRSGRSRDSRWPRTVRPSCCTSASVHVRPSSQSSVDSAGGAVGRLAFVRHTGGVTVATEARAQVAVRPVTDSRCSRAAVPKGMISSRSSSPFPLQSVSHSSGTPLASESMLVPRCHVAIVRDQVVSCNRLPIPERSRNRSERPRRDRCRRCGSSRSFRCGASNS